MYRSLRPSKVKLESESGPLTAVVVWSISARRVAVQQGTGQLAEEGRNWRSPRLLEPLTMQIFSALANGHCKRATASSLLLPRPLLAPKSEDYLSNPTPRIHSPPPSGLALTTLQTTCKRPFANAHLPESCPKRLRPI